MMDYEKAYKAVLQTATQWIKDGCTDEERICLECVFPELRESEDERIIEEIKFAIMQMPSEREDTKQRCLAYLEKQKGNQYFVGYAKGYSEGQLNPKQKEQKPAISTPIFRVGDYIRNKKTGDKVIIEQIDVKLKIYFYVSFDGVATVYSDFKWEDQNDWELIGQKIEQKPSEKQDYSCLTDFERAIHRGFLCAGVENVPVTIIKETAQECMTKIKPAWSEKDEKMRNLALDWAETLAGQCSFVGINPTDFRKIISWLKSLRPSWKPSEEQLKELNFARLGRTPNVVHEHLDSLYNDLLKLK